MEILEELESNGFNPPIRHVANSGAILNFPESMLTMVRPGLLLHGVPSFPGSTPEGFRTIARLESEIVQITEYPEGTPFGYSASYRVKRKTRAAVIPIGYADGLNRLLSNRAEVLIKGKRVPMIGRISMDLTIVDVTDLNGIKLGDMVTILGKDGDDEITAWEMSDIIGSIPWEIFCWIGPRVPRVYVHD
jgi:alanine racemase